MFSNLLHPPHVWFPNSFSQWAMSKARHLSCGAAVLQIPTYWRTKNFHHLPCMKHYKTMSSHITKKKKKHRKTTSLNLQDSSILHIHHIINISPFHSCSYPFLHVCSWVSPFRSSIASRNSCSSSRTSLTSSRPCEKLGEYLCWIENLYIKSWEMKNNTIRTYN